MSNAAFVDTFFNQVFDRVQNTLEFKPEWANGTGYLDHCAEGPHAPVLAPGEMAKSTDNFGRPMVIIGLPVGNLVVFRRYSKESGVYTYNASREFDQHWMGTYCQGKQTLEDLKALFGEWSDSENIGQRMPQKTDLRKTILDVSGLNPFGEFHPRHSGYHMFKNPNVNDEKINERNNARNNLESWIDENVSPEKQDELRSLIAAYSVSSEAIHRS